MSTAITQQERSALEDFGGYDAYQNHFYTAFTEKLERLPFSEVRFLDKVEEFGYLNGGLGGLLDKQQPLTSRAIDSLVGFLGMGSDVWDTSSKISQEHREYWTRRLEAYDEVDFIIKMGWELGKESDAITKQRLAAAA